MRILPKKLSFILKESKVKTVLSGLNEGEIWIEQLTFAVQGEKTEGTAECYQMRMDYACDALGKAPMMQKGFLQFSGTFNSCTGTFLAGEEGVNTPSGRKVSGRILDATDELLTLKGEYEYFIKKDSFIKGDEKGDEQTESSPDRKLILEKGSVIDVHFYGEF